MIEKPNHSYMFWLISSRIQAVHIYMYVLTVSLVHWTNGGLSFL